MKYNKALIILSSIVGVLMVSSIGYVLTGGKIVKASGSMKIVRKIDNKYVVDNFADNIMRFKESKADEYDGNTWHLTKMTYKELGIKPYIKKQDSDKINKKTLINENNIIVSYDTSNIYNALNKINKDRKESKAPYIKREGNEFIAVKGISGEALDIEKLKSYIDKRLSNPYDRTIIVDLSDFYKKQDKSIVSYEELKEQADKFNSEVIDYTNGAKLECKDYIDYFKITKKGIKIDSSKEGELTAKLDSDIDKKLKSYDTVGKPMKFKTHNGKKVKISGGYWGNIFDSSAETKHVKKLFSHFTSENNRKPIFSQEMPDEIGDDYIEVSIKKQHVWHYVNGKVHCDSPVVTGNTTDGHNTPTGVFYLLEVTNGKELKPKGATKGTWVDKWMRVTWDGVGLHDASWRYNFGGEIYKGNGSHGCVNMPKDFAYKLFKEVKYKYPVIIHNK